LLLASQLVTVERSLLVIGGRRLQKGEGMKIRHLLVFGLVAAFGVSLASIVANAAAAETPFKGTLSAVETGTTVFPTRFLDREGTGTATYLGRYTEHVTMVINIPTLSSTGAATFTAANGDTLLTRVAGQATRTSPTTLSILEVYTITGGTGRFADVTGSFTLKSTLDQTTGVSTGTFRGAIDH
jgi:hypothetical protein